MNFILLLLIVSISVYGFSIIEINKPNKFILCSDKYTLWAKVTNISGPNKDIFYRVDLKIYLKNRRNIKQSLHFVDLEELTKYDIWNHYKNKTFISVYFKCSMRHNWNTIHLSPIYYTKVDKPRYIYYLLVLSIIAISVTLTYQIKSKN